MKTATFCRDSAVIHCRDSAAIHCRDSVVIPCRDSVALPRLSSGVEIGAVDLTRRIKLTVDMRFLRLGPPAGPGFRLFL